MTQCKIFMHLINELENHLSSTQSILREYKDQIKWQLIIIKWRVLTRKIMQLNFSPFFLTHNKVFFNEDSKILIILILQGSRFHKCKIK